jgi:hypothetical protein
VLVLLLTDHLLLETVELDGFLIQFIYTVHKAAQLAFQNRSEHENENSTN